VFAPWYDAIQRFFSRLTHAGTTAGVTDPSVVSGSRTANTIPIVFANPDRAHEELVSLLQTRAERSGRPTSQQEITDRAAVMPYMSLWMTRPQHDGRYFNPGRVSFEHDRKAGTVKTTPWPRSMKCRVQVDLYAQQDGGEFIAQNVVGQSELMFRSGYLVTLPVNWTAAKWYKHPFNILEHAKILGHTRLRLYLDSGWDDHSELEFAEAGKEGRLTWRGRVEGSIAYPPNEVRYELFDNTDEDNPVLLETQISGADD